jgi:hypothetical protein
MLAVPDMVGIGGKGSVNNLMHGICWPVSSVLTQEAPTMIWRTTQSGQNPRRSQVCAISWTDSWISRVSSDVTCLGLSIGNSSTFKYRHPAGAVPPRAVV